MLLIDPDGMFNGDRLALLSDEARLYWPWMYLASNGFARLELNYRRLLGRAFGAFRNPPTEQQVMGFAREYFEAHLLFLYRSNGQLWGQWWTSEKYLPRFKTASDKRSPEPPSEEFLKWQDAYASKRVEAVKPSDLSTISEIVPKDFTEDARVVAVAVADAVSEKTCSNGMAASGSTLLVLTSPAEDPRRAATALERQQAGWFGEWWAIYWRRVAKKAAWDAFKKAVRTEEMFRLVMEATRKQAPIMFAREAAARPHGSTWLHGKRWEDDLEAEAAQCGRRTARDEAFAAL